MAELLNCPLCDVALFHNGASELGDIYDHPLNGCAIQVAWFTATSDWVEKWNRRPSPSISEGEVEALIAEAADFTERMTGQPWACELIERLAALLASSKARATTEVEVKADEAGKWITTRNELGGFTEFVSEDVPVVVRTMHAGVDLLMDVNDRQRIIGYRVYDLTNFDALAEAWCGVAGKAIDALDTIAGWDANGFDSYEIVAPITGFAEKSVAEIRAAYPKPVASPSPPPRTP